jgi:hypothetical protein
MAANNRKTSSLKDTLSHDYGIPGISPRFYRPVALIAFGVGGAGAWWITASWGAYDGWFYTSPIAVIIAFAVVVTISTVLETIQRMIRRLRG